MDAQRFVSEEEGGYLQSWTRGDLSYVAIVLVSVLSLSSTSRGGEFQLVSTTETRGPENDLAFS